MYHQWGEWCRQGKLLLPLNIPMWCILGKEKVYLCIQRSFRSPFGCVDWSEARLTIYGMTQINKEAFYDFRPHSWIQFPINFLTCLCMCHLKMILNVCLLLIGVLVKEWNILHYWNNVDVLGCTDASCVPIMEKHLWMVN